MDTDLKEYLKKHIQKLSKIIIELQKTEREFHAIVHKKLTIDTKDPLKDDIITTNLKDELLKEDEQSEFNRALSKLDQMVNDNDIWYRRKVENEKIVEYESKLSKVEPIPSKRSNNIISDQFEIPNSDLINPEERNAPFINGLTRLSPDERSKKLYTIYLQAVETVKSVVGEFYNEEEHADLVSNESDKLLEIWLKNN